MDIRTQTQLLALDHGLERIIHGDGTQALLPQQHSVLPSDLEAVGQLDRLFHQPSLENVLEDSVRPKVENRDILGPTAFCAALDKAHKTLHKLAEQDEGNSRILNRCARLLKDEFELRDLIAMYRGALYQG